MRTTQASAKSMPWSRYFLTRASTSAALSLSSNAISKSPRRSISKTGSEVPTLAEISASTGSQTSQGGASRSSTCLAQPWYASRASNAAAGSPGCTRRRGLPRSCSPARLLTTRSWAATAAKNSAGSGAEAPPATPARPPSGNERCWGISAPPRGKSGVVFRARPGRSVRGRRHPEPSRLATGA